VSEAGEVVRIIPEGQLSRQLIEKCALYSELDVKTVRTLLNAGYSYVETLNQPIKWVKNSYLRKV
jgi:hypothetical protein